MAGFADATGRFLPLVVHGQRRPGAVRDRAGCSAPTWTGSPRWRWRPSPGAGGLTLLPYLDGERTPNRPDATGVLRGLTTRNATGQNLARAAVEAVLPRWPRRPT